MADILLNDVEGSDNVEVVNPDRLVYLVFKVGEPEPIGVFDNEAAALAHPAIPSGAYVKSFKVWS